MVLKLKLILLSLLAISNIFSNNKVEIFHTDKFNVNYLSSKTSKTTSLNIGSDLFRFLSIEQLTACGTYIDSFLREQKIEFSQNVSFNNNNNLSFELINVDANSCFELSKIWHSNYNYSLGKILYNYIKEIEEKDFNASKLVFNKLLLDEFSRFYNPTNTVNNISLAFVVPISQSKNNFSKIHTYLNTKRYSLNEPSLNVTEIIIDNALNDNEIKLSYPSVNKHTFLKKSLGVHLIKLMHSQKIDFSIDYNILQSIVHLNFTPSSKDLSELTIPIDSVYMNPASFYDSKLQAYNSVLNSIDKDNLFFYNYSQHYYQGRHHYTQVY